jgi:hypothetical protein
MDGAQKLAGVKSFIATGHSERYGGLGGNAAFQIFLEAPDRRGMWINFPEHPDRGMERLDLRRENRLDRLPTGLPD